MLPLVRQMLSIRRSCTKLCYLCIRHIVAPVKRSGLYIHPSPRPRLHLHRLVARMAFSSSRPVSWSCMQGLKSSFISFVVIIHPLARHGRMLTRKQCPCMPLLSLSLRQSSRPPVRNSFDSKKKQAVRKTRLLSLPFLSQNSGSHPGRRVQHISTPLTTYSHR